MTTDLEADLRREFDAATPPLSLSFSPDSVLRQGNRTIRRRRIMAGGSAAMAVALVAVGASLLTRPHDTALPLPATRTATTGIAKADAGFVWGHVQVQFDRDVRVQPNVRFFGVTQDGLRHEVGSSSTGKPGQTPDAVWRSGIVGGHPVTIGLFPGSNADLPTITFADGGSYGVGGEELKGTGYTMFYVDYTGPDGGPQEPSRPSEIASIRWSGPTGIVDGIEGNHRLTGRALTIGKGVSVEVVLRPGDGALATVSGDARLRDAQGGYAMPLTVAATDAHGAAVVTGRYPTSRRFTDKDGIQGRYVGSDGAPIAAGILPPGASNIGVVLTTNEVASGLPVLERMPDGRVIFAVKAEAAQPSSPSKDSIKAVTWTNADGTQGRIDVTQKQS